MANTPLSNQISNRNFLSPVGFKFIISKNPKISFFCNSVKLPEISLPTLTQPSYLKDIDVPGDKIDYGDLVIKFLVDEDMVNYVAIHNWITGIGFPESTNQFKELTTNDLGIRDLLEITSDASLQILNSNYQVNSTIKFKDVYPVSLTPLEFESNATDIRYFTSQAIFKYTIYNILGKDGKEL
jgi:hypothetical protein